MSSDAGSATSAGVRIVDPSQLRVNDVTVEMKEDGPRIVGQPTIEVRADIWQHWLVLEMRSQGGHRREPD